MRDLDIKEQSLNAICRYQAARAPYEVKVVKVVGVFCDSETYPTEDQVKRWSDQSFVVVVGLHPKRRDSPKSTDGLRALLVGGGWARRGRLG